MNGLREEPLAWGLGVAFGGMIAAFIGGYLPTWGVALAAPGATLMFAIGAVQVPEDPWVARVLRTTVALTIGFIAVTVPVTLGRLSDSEEAALHAQDVLGARDLDEVTSALTTMWIAMAAMVPVGAGALVLRARRLKAS